MRLQMEVKDSKIEELLKVMEASHRATQNSMEHQIIAHSHDPLREVSRESLNVYL